MFLNLQTRKKRTYKEKLKTQNKPRKKRGGKPQASKLHFPPPALFLKRKGGVAAKIN
jgi:hypothetical protein